MNADGTLGGTFENGPEYADSEMGEKTADALRAVLLPGGGG